MTFLQLPPSFLTFRMSSRDSTCQELDGLVLIMDGDGQETGVRCVGCHLHIVWILLTSFMSEEQLGMDRISINRLYLISLPEKQPFAFDGHTDLL
jgi:hypothetical protein